MTSLTFAAALVSNMLAIVLYTGASLFLLRQLLVQQSVNRQVLFALTSLAICLHGFGVSERIFTEQGFTIGFFQSSSLIFAVINAIVLISSARKPVHNLFILLFPMSALAVACSLLPATATIAYKDMQPGLASHILLSILAYSLLTMASLQAVLLAYQNHRLKHKQLGGISRLLAPLQTMEQLLFEILWAGQLLLTAAIATGFIYLDDLFAQQLAHKTILAIIAWCIYSILLWGRHVNGWRGITAIRWTLVGFIALMLGYFGSKLVLEIIL